MKSFMDEDFLLSNDTARKLYHNYAEKMPIVDYHCHINPKEIAEDRTFDSITQIWLGGDHYKWRVMRANGVREDDVTGKGSDWEKFEAWAETLPKCIGNPLYHWTHLELKRYFGFDGALNGSNARQVFENCNAKLRSGELSVRKIIEKSDVRLICTTDDPADGLKYHRQIAEDPTCKVQVLPAFRPDKSVNIDKEGFAAYLEKLGKVAGVTIASIDDLTGVLAGRVAFFNQMGCRASDHGLDYVVYQTCTREQADEVLKKALAGQAVSSLEADRYKTYMLLFFGRQYAKYGWVMQLHMGVLRNVNGRMFRQLGPDTGYDATGDYDHGQALAGFLNDLENTSELPKTILYSINPADNEILATVGGSFQSDTAVGKIQLGSGWWYNDQKDGMIRQMTCLANVGVLANFVGMLTDSRSFLSYTRHEYFRRILCNLIGTWVENGEYPADMEALGQMVQDISYNNAVRYFGFPV